MPWARSFLGGGSLRSLRILKSRMGAWTSRNGRRAHNMEVSELGCLIHRMVTEVRTRDDKKLVLGYNGFSRLELCEQRPESGNALTPILTRLISLRQETMTTLRAPRLVDIAGSAHIEMARMYNQFCLRDYSTHPVAPTIFHGLTLDVSRSGKKYASGIAAKSK